MAAGEQVALCGRRFVAGAAALAIGLAGCGGSSRSREAAPAGRPLHIYRVAMSGRAQRPHGAPRGAGAAVIAIHAGALVCWRFAHLHGFVSATVAHLHAGRAGTQGPVVIALSTAPALHHQGCTHAGKAVMTAIERHPAGYYVDVHSARYSAGAVRGQL